MASSGLTPTDPCPYTGVPEVTIVRTEAVIKAHGFALVLQ